MTTLWRSPPERLGQKCFPGTQTTIPCGRGGGKVHYMEFFVQLDENEKGAFEARSKCKNQEICSVDNFFKKIKIREMSQKK